jgi:hypothetical protein
MQFIFLFENCFLLYANINILFVPKFLLLLLLLRYYLFYYSVITLIFTFPRNLF